MEGQPEAVHLGQDCRADPRIPWTTSSTVYRRRTLGVLPRPSAPVRRSTGLVDLDEGPGHRQERGSVAGVHAAATAAARARRPLPRRVGLRGCDPAPWWSSALAQRKTGPAAAGWFGWRRRRGRRWRRPPPRRRVLRRPPVLCRHRSFSGSGTRVRAAITLRAGGCEPHPVLKALHTGMPAPVVLTWIETGPTPAA